MEIITYGIVLVLGFVTGVLVCNNNNAKINKIIADLEKKIEELKNKGE